MGSCNKSFTLIAVSTANKPPYPFQRCICLRNAEMGADPWGPVSTALARARLAASARPAGSEVPPRLASDPLFDLVCGISSEARSIHTGHTFQQVHGFAPPRPGGYAGGGGGLSAAAPGASAAASAPQAPECRRSPGPWRGKAGDHCCSGWCLRNGATGDKQTLTGSARGRLYSRLACRGHRPSSTGRPCQSRLRVPADAVTAPVCHDVLPRHPRTASELPSRHCVWGC